jgi:hypothetical protein
LKIKLRKCALRLARPAFTDAAAFAFCQLYSCDFVFSADEMAQVVGGPSINPYLMKLGCLPVSPLASRPNVKNRSIKTMEKFLSDVLL